MKLPRPPSHVVFLAAVFVSGLAVLSGFRAVFHLLARGTEPALPAGVLARAFATGARFDAAVSGYLLAPPLLLLSLLAVAGRRPRAAHRIAAWALGLGYASVFLVAAADLPYYRRFGTRVTAAALSWADTPRFFLDSTLGDPAHRPYEALFLAASIGFGLLLGALRRKLLDGRPQEEDGAPRPARRAALAAAWSLAALALVFLAVRGRVAQSSPLRTGAAFFSPHALASQVALNPAFVFWNSVLEEGRGVPSLVPGAAPGAAIAAARRFLGIETGDGFSSPIARRVDPGSPPRDLNVVLVLMEGMAAPLLARHGGAGLTPRLDALVERGLSFDRIYASGIHTHSGVYATLFSMPALPGAHPMKGARILGEAGGLARTLRERGYRTVFLCPHDAQIDNMEGFLTAGGYDRVLDLDDWPEDRIAPNLRLPDHALFDEALPVLRETAAGGRPFLAVLLTVSNHPRHYLPEGIPFRPRSEDPALRMVEYADWSLGRFLDLASREPWFASTIFAFVSDHGASPGAGAPPEARYHVPLLLYAPAVLGPPRAIDALGSQIDVGPTVLGLMGRPWVDETLGIDLLRARRRAVCWCDDESASCFDGKTLLTRRLDGVETLRPAQGVEADPEEAARAEALLRERFLSLLEASRVLLGKGASP